MLVKNDDQTKMEEGEYFAIETFGSTGRGRIVESVRDNCFLDPPDETEQPLLYRENVPTMRVAWMLQMYHYGKFKPDLRQTIYLNDLVLRCDFPVLHRPSRF